MTKIHMRAGEKASKLDLINVQALLDAYYDIKPQFDNPNQEVIFGTSGHRGSALKGSFNETHILAIAQAIVDFRQVRGITGPVFIGKDTHLLSTPALHSVLEVFAANHVETYIAEKNGDTPTPVISHAIIQYNKSHPTAQADGVVLTPSHNPPEDGGIKYNSTHGGPAAGIITTHIEKRANELLEGSLADVKRISLKRAQQSGYIHEMEYEKNYIDDLANVIDMDAIRQSALRLGVDPLGGAGHAYWSRIAEQYQLNLTIVNDAVDPTFEFMHLDHDGLIRMDCSSAYAMAGLISLKDRFDLAFGNDTDSDRHGIVTSAGLMNPNDYLTAATDYLFSCRPRWDPKTAVGKTLVTSAMIDKVASMHQRRYLEYPVGFKWYAEGLFEGKLGFACEESAGGSFLRHNGRVWTTDKDGIILCLLAAEMTAKTGKNPQQRYENLTARLGHFYYGRMQAKATLSEKNKLSHFDAVQLKANTLVGDKIIASLTTAPANDAPIGGLKVVTNTGWFAVRPSGTEPAYKIYAESFVSREHLEQIAEEAKQVVADAIN